MNFPRKELGRVSIRAEELLGVVRDLDRRIFPTDCHVDLHRGEQCRWWTLRVDGYPLGFCGARKIEESDLLVLERAGLLPAARGRGLQRPMIRVRKAWGRRVGCKEAITYTVTDNYPSANNLISEGFRLYEPEYQWAGPGVLYWSCKL